MIDYIAGDGILPVRSRIVSADLYRIACLAHELFGMSAINDTRRCPIYLIVLIQWFARLLQGQGSRR